MEYLVNCKIPVQSCPWRWSFVFHKTRQVLHERVIFLKCESIFSCDIVLYRIIKNSSETYKALSRRFGKSTQIFHGKPSSNLFTVFSIYSYFKKGCSCDPWCVMHGPCFIARSALWEQAKFKICLLRTRKTFVGELFGFGFSGAIQRKKPVSISEYQSGPYGATCKVTSFLVT